MKAPLSRLKAYQAGKRADKVRRRENGPNKTDKPAPDETSSGAVPEARAAVSIPGE